jgi:hypothetical protein
MGGTENRVGFGSVCAGVVVALAFSAMLVALGAALAGSTIGLDPETLVANRTGVGVWLGVALALGAFLGGRSAAVSARLMVRRDGALAGMVTWGLLVILVVALAAAWSAAAPGIAARVAARPLELLWAIFAGQLITLLAAVLGGVAGARAEARSIGLRSVHVAKRGFVTAPDSYERDFFGSASLSSSNHSTAP